MKGRKNDAAFSFLRGKILVLRKKPPTDVTEQGLTRVIGGKEPGEKEKDSCGAVFSTANFKGRGLRRMATFGRCYSGLIRHLGGGVEKEKCCERPTIFRRGGARKASLFWLYEKNQYDFAG